MTLTNSEISNSFRTVGINATIARMRKDLGKPAGRKSEPASSPPPMSPDSVKMSPAKAGKTEKVPAPRESTLNSDELAFIICLEQIYGPKFDREKVIGAFRKIEDKEGRINLSERKWGFLPKGSKFGDVWVTEVMGRDDTFAWRWVDARLNDFFGNQNGVLDGDTTTIKEMAERLKAFLPQLIAIRELDSAGGTASGIDAFTSGCISFVPTDKKLYDGIDYNKLFSKQNGMQNPLASLAYYAESAHVRCGGTRPEAGNDYNKLPDEIKRLVFFLLHNKFKRICEENKKPFNIDFSGKDYEKLSKADQKKLMKKYTQVIEYWGATRNLPNIKPKLSQSFNQALLEYEVPKIEKDPPKTGTAPFPVAPPQR